MKDGSISWRPLGFALAIGAISWLSPAQLSAAAGGAVDNGPRTVNPAPLPAELRGELLARNAGSGSRVEPGLHLSRDGAAFLYGGPDCLEELAAGVGDAARQGPSPYTAVLARELAGGIEVTAAGSAWSVKLVPLSASSLSGAISGDTVEYAGSPGTKVVYSFRSNGVKEEIVLDRVATDAATFDFRLEMDPILSAGLDDKGNLLIHGPDSVLGGNVQAGDQKSAELLMKARQRAPKSRLLYVIPAPVVLDGTGRKQPGLARFTLDDGTLTLHAAGLAGLTAPVTIDPSVVVTTTADFMTGNNEGMITFDTDAISRSTFSAGTVVARLSTTSLPSARYYHAAAQSNGFVYLLGGSYGSSSLDDVWVSPVDYFGELGTWVSQPGFATGRYGHAAVAYNGFLYVLGGRTGSTELADVQFAPLSADGSIGSWTATSSFTTARHFHSAVAWNGYLYLLGGFAGGTSYFSDVQYAPFNPDGTLGAWSATTSFTAGRYGHTSAAHNGFLYIVGGNSGSARGDVQFAPLGADGTVGSWTVTTPLPSGRYLHSSAVRGGHLFVVGGNNGSAALDEVRTAPLNANGTVGAWSVNPNGYGHLSSARFGHAAVAGASRLYDRLYVLGGANVAVLDDVESLDFEEYGGLTGDFVTGPSFLNGRYGHTSVAWNGYLYVIGGETNSQRFSDVQFAPIGSDGTVGSWSGTTGLPEGLSDHASVVFNGYLYAVGGYADSGRSNKVYVAPLNANGTVGAWSATSAFATPRTRLTCVAWNGYIYVIGGLGTAALLSDVQYASIHANGALGAWATTTALSAARYEHASAVYDGYVYVLQGYGNSGWLEDMLRAPVNPSDGTLGSWVAATGSVINKRDSHSAVAYNGHLYLVGGKNDVVYLPGVDSTRIGESFANWPWGLASQGPSARIRQAAVPYNGHLYVTGGVGSDGIDKNDVQAAPTSQRGFTGTPRVTNPFATPRSGHRAVAANGYLYVVAGWGGGSYRNDVQYAPISSNGLLGAWTATTSLASPRAYHAVAAYNGYLYVLGGDDGGYRNDVKYAPINSDGTLGSWSAAPAFTGTRAYFAAVASNGYLYIVGGWNGGYLNDVQYAPINPDGSLGSWITTTSFLAPARYGHTAVVNGGRIYLIGGEGSTGVLADVQYATLNADGSVAAWNETAKLLRPVVEHASVAWNGYLYAIGGTATGIGGLADVQVTALCEGRACGWMSATKLATARFLHAAAVHDGWLYVLGGQSDLVTYLNDVTVATLNGEAARGRYSRLFDLGETRIIDSLGFHGSPVDGIVNLTFATGAPGLGARTTIPDAQSGAIYTTGLGTCGRYVWASLDLDDRSSATAHNFGLNGRRDLLDLAINYTDITATNVAASATAPNQITVSWDAVAGATCYHVYRRRGSCSSSTYSLLASCVAGTNYVDNTVSGGSTYSYKIRTEMPSGCTSSYSACAEALATGDCNIVPTFLGVGSVAYDGAAPSCRIHLAWPAGVSRCTSGPGLSYHVYRSTEPAFVPAAGNRIAQCVSGLALDDADVTLGTTYYYVVRAEDTTTAGGGPCNGGNVDTNTTRKGATTGLSVLFADGFEDGMGSWAGTANWTDTTTQAHTGTHSADSGSVPSTCGRLLHAAIAIPAGASNPRLRFWTRYMLRTIDGEAGIVQGSSNGTAWTKLTVSPAYPGTSDASTNSCLGTNPQPAFTGGSSTWTEYSVNLSSYAGGNFYFRFNVVTVPAFPFFSAWYIDDVSVTYESSCSTAAHPGQVSGALSLSRFQEDVILSWSAPGGSCSVTSYGVYRGTLPMTGYNHASRDCAVGGTTYTDVNPTGDYYYVVVPLNSTYEGACGTDSEGGQIPQGTGPCRTRDTTSCN